MKFLGLDHPFFVPLWRRIAVVVFCLGWAVVEFTVGSPFFGVIMGALGIYCAREFFIDYEPPSSGEKPDSKD